jgi:Ubiquitin carboxyl-terminal hydrolase
MPPRGSSIGAAGSKKSKTGGGKRHTPPLIPLPPPRQEGDQISPAETTGPSPSLKTPRLIVQTIVDNIESKEFEPDVTPMGFTNNEAPKYPTNICYRNAVISMLLNIPTFSKLLTVYRDRQDVIEQDPEAIPTAPAPMVQSLVLLNQRYWTGVTSGKQDELNKAMNIFWKEFTEIEPPFSENEGKNQWRQEDAEEFLSNLLSRMEEQLDKYVR